jgi:hypothetical protein
MARSRRSARKPRRKAVKVQLIDRPERKPRTPDPECPYGYLDKMLQHHPHLDEAKIAVAWMLDVKANVDGFLMLGKCKKQSDLDREMREFDFVIFINATAWKHLNEKQRAALVDHELHHAGVAEDKKTGEPVLDERGRRVYRIKKHDIEEFAGVVKRHGLYKADLATFAKACSEAPLFPLPKLPTATAPESNPNEQAVPSETNDKVNGHPHTNVDEDWRTIPIGEALQGLGSRIYKSFEDANINTLGDLTEFQARHGDFWVKDLAGVGPKAAEDIADASEAFWKRRKVPA